MMKPNEMYDTLELLRLAAVQRIESEFMDKTKEFNNWREWDDLKQQLTRAADSALILHLKEDYSDDSNV